MNELELIMLHEIQNCLTYYGFENEIRNDRVGGPYINIGDVHRITERVQFWYDTDQCVTKLWGGKYMGRWYSESLHSDFKQKWEKLSDKENLLVFPHLFMAFNYIKSIAE